MRCKGQNAAAARARTTERVAFGWRCPAALAGVVLIGAPAGGGQDPASLSAYEQRLAYQRAVFAVRRGRSGEFRREQAKLRDYALHPYLVYYDARQRLASLSAKRADSVYAALADTPLAARFRRSWLNAQARRGRWDVYLANYEPSEDAAARCNHLRALYRTGKRAEALDQVRPLWIAPTSQPKTCDPLFEAWIGAGRLDQDAVWTRLERALDANEVSLARYLLRFFDAANSAAGKLYYDVHVRPRLVRSLARFRDDENGRRALRHGLLRYARRSAPEALALWRGAAGKRAFDDAERRYIEEAIVAAAAESGQAPKQGPSGFAPENTLRIAQALVWHSQWAPAATWIRALPADIAAKPRWRYWLGEALRRTGAETASREQLLAIAGLRTYYGFLAAEALDQTPALNAIEPRLGEAGRAALLRVPAVRRMTELYAVGDRLNARREWRHAAAALPPAQQRELVEWTAAIGWGEQAIFGAREGEMANLLAIRFPTPHIDIFRRHAFQTELPIHFLHPIARQESAFNPRAVSSAGARGLMQLMPSTARDIANRVRLARPSSDGLLIPEVNVRLAAHHIARLMRRYKGNRAVVAAAYNAGEHRVARWLKDADGMPTSVWTDRIPFRETRDYVKAVIAFAQVYAQLAGETPPVLAPHERTIETP